MRHKRVSLTDRMLIIAGILSLLVVSSPASAQDGEKLFKQNCTSCHNLEKKSIGPMLQGARASWAERTGDDEAIIAWVQNSQDYIKKAGDSYAKDLLAEYNGTVMTPMALSAEEVLATLDFVDAYVPAEPVVDDTAGGEVVAQEDSNPTMWLVLIALLVLIVARVLWGVSRSLQSAAQQGDGGDALPDQTFFGSLVAYLKRNTPVTVVLVVLAFAYLSVLGWDWLNDVGVYEGYQPKQPIWFSHKIHAGQNGINCVYCHNSVEKGKAAGIPSVNICMNCHKGVQEGTVTGTKEIQKIYDAIGFDPEKLAYIDGYEQKPIEWVRIHNLQDFVYFNHSQHVVVGKQECQTCHGPVEEMDELYQYSPLTMGWCVDCHRETDVSMDGNGYYEKMHAELVEKYKNEGLETFKVEHIGGLECAKCHY